MLVVLISSRDKSMVSVSNGYITPIRNLFPVFPPLRRLKSAGSLISYAGRRQAVSHFVPVETSMKKKSGSEGQMRLAERISIERLKRIDSQVRAHEQAHLVLLNGYARGGPHYIYAIGPDGRLYAVGGSVDVNLRSVPGNPEATLRKARILRRAAFGPMQPSAADLRVAAAAYRMEIEARRELAEEKETQEALEASSKQEAGAMTGQYIDVYA